MNTTGYVNSYFAYQQNENGIDGVIAKVIEAERYLNLMILGVQALSELFFKSKEENFHITDELKRYINFAKSKYPFESPDDKRLLNNHAFNYLHNFSKVRDFLKNKGEYLLKRTAVVLSVQIVKNSY
jgi:hypothetical protein